jgi:NAD(P)-dependent dehydrogenase (short-subunit alcohol dehydrogenase family)
MKRPNWAGKTVLITGAAGGLGAALCQRYAAGGARIAAMDRDADKLRATAASLPADTLLLGGAQAGDITQPDACRSAVDATVARFGGIDALINNAGISHRSLFADTDTAVIRRVMEVNFFGAMQLTHAALPHVIASRGVIAAISSVAGYAPLLGRTGYCASKHALQGFFDTLRTEVSDLGVDVTLVCPSFIATGIGGAALGGSGASVHGPRITTGGESAPGEIAELIYGAIAAGKPLLLPDRTSRLAWWVSKLAPAFYARAMRQRVGSEFRSP